MSKRDTAPITPPTSSIEEETDEAGSGDEQVLDELAVSPTPSVDSDTDLIVEATGLPGDLPGRASSTSEDLGELFGSDSGQHMADGFAGSGDSDGESINQNDGDDLDPGAARHPSGA